jgi:hypothetical protein
LHKCWKTRESYALKLGTDQSTSAQTDPQRREKLALTSALSRCARPLHGWNTLPLWGRTQRDKALVSAREKLTRSWWKKSKGNRTLRLTIDLIFQ